MRSHCAVPARARTPDTSAAPPCTADETPPAPPYTPSSDTRSPPGPRTHGKADSGSCLITLPKIAPWRKLSGRTRNELIATERAPLASAEKIVKLAILRAAVVAHLSR